MQLPKLFNEDWATFFELSHDGIVIADHQGNIVYMNPAAERLEETSKEHILGRTARELLEEGIYQVSVTVKVFESRKTETAMDTKGGRQLILTGVPIFDKKGGIKWVYINERDVTELNQVKRELENDRLQLQQYRNELSRIREETSKQRMIIGKSAKVKQNMELLKRLAPTETLILIEGESGTGKDVHARWIHEHSLRAAAVFIKVDCGALSETLLESELFGYEEGAFTGAKRKGKKGLVEEADGGTLFLDEIGELPINLQTKLLRLVQEKTFIPVGGVKSKSVDIRLIAATNKDLKKMVSQKTFREDLYYRLNVIPLRLPALRERKEDIFEFVNFFLESFNKKHGYRKEMAPEAIAALCSYQWPGNVRELSNIMERLIIVTSKSTIGREDILRAMPEYEELSLGKIIGENTRYEEAKMQFEKEYFKYMLREGKTLKTTAETIGISESTLKRKLRKCGLTGRRV